METRHPPKEAQNQFTHLTALLSHWLVEKVVKLLFTPVWSTQVPFEVHWENNSLRDKASGSHWNCLQQLFYTKNKNQRNRPVKEPKRIQQ